MTAEEKKMTAAESEAVELEETTTGEQPAEEKTEEKKTKKAKKEKKEEGPSQRDLDRILRINTGAKIQQAIAEAVTQSAHYMFDTTTKAVERYAYYVGVQYKTASADAKRIGILCKVWPNVTFIDIETTRRLVSTVKDAPNVKKMGHIVNIAVVDGDMDAAIKTAISIINQLMVDGVPVEKPKKEPKPKKEKKPAEEKTGETAEKKAEKKPNKSKRKPKKEEVAAEPVEETLAEEVAAEQF